MLVHQRVPEDSSDSQTHQTRLHLVEFQGQVGHRHPRLPAHASYQAAGSLWSSLSRRRGMRSLMNFENWMFHAVIWLFKGCRPCRRPRKRKWHQTPVCFRHISWDVCKSFAKLGVCEEAWNIQWSTRFSQNHALCVRSKGGTARPEKMIADGRWKVLKYQSVSSIYARWRRHWCPIFADICNMLLHVVTSPIFQLNLPKHPLNLLCVPSSQVQSAAGNLWGRTGLCRSSWKSGQPTAMADVCRNRRRSGDGSSQWPVELVILVHLKNCLVVSNMTFILHDIWRVIRNSLTNFHIFRSAMLLARELYTVAVVHGLELLSGAVFSRV